MTKSRGIRPSKAPWSEEHLQLLRELYSDHRTADIARRIERSERSIYSKAQQLGLKKSEAFLASGLAGRLDGVRGGATRFKKGHVTWNKGTNFTSGGRSAETRFKPGHRGGKAAELYQPIGTERISKDGYLERKINDDMPLQKRWRAVHLLVWESAHGSVPPGHAVSFKDRNKQNTALENLELVSRAELMRRNSYHQYGPEIAKLVQLRGAVTRQINKREKKA